LSYELNRRVELEIEVALSREAVTFILAEEQPDGNLLGPRGIDDLMRFRDRYARVVLAVDDEHRVRDVLDQRHR
jgi:hypothetical protein